MILFKTLIKDFLFYFINSLISFITIFVAADLISKGGLLNSGLGLVIEYYLSIIPEILFILIPLAVLMAILVLVSQLVKNNELIALYSVGVSRKQVLVPLVVAISFIIVFQLILSDRIIPYSKERHLYVKEVKMKRNESTFLQKKEKIWSRGQDFIYYMHKFDRTTNQAHYIEVYYLDNDWKIHKQIKATSALFKEVGLWVLNDVTEIIYNNVGGEIQIQKYKEKAISLKETPKDFMKFSIDPSDLGLIELMKYISKNKAIGLRTNHYETALHGKLVLAFAPLLMLFIAIPFSFRFNRNRNIAKDISFCLGIALLFIIVFAFAQSIGNNGVVNPMISTWLVYFLFLGGSALAQKWVPLF